MVYKLIKSDGSFCPNCRKEAYLLRDKKKIELPAFYICFDCNFIGEVGVGVVKEEVCF